jgi:hypothetical protein
VGQIEDPRAAEDHDQALGEDHVDAGRADAEQRQLPRLAHRVTPLRKRSAGRSITLLTQTIYQASWEQDGKKTIRIQTILFAISAIALYPQ